MRWRVLVMGLNVCCALSTLEWGVSISFKPLLVLIEQVGIINSDSKVFASQLNTLFLIF